MSLRTETRTIDGQQFVITAIPGGIAFDNAPRVLAHIAAGVEKLKCLNVLGGIEQLLSMEIAQGGAALKAVCERLPPEEMSFLRRLLFERATVDGRPLLDMMDAGHIRGGVVAMFKALWVALVLSFGPFGSLAELFRASPASP